MIAGGECFLACSISTTLRTDGSAMQVDLTEDQKAFIRDGIQSGRFTREEDALHEALSLWEGRERRRIEELAATIESCRKFILASRIALAGGGLLLAGMLFGAIRSDLGLMAAAVSLLLGGIVAWGSNTSTAKEATKELAAAESSARL